MNHIHVSAMTALTAFLMVALVGTLWRLASMHLSDSSIGKAMAFIY